MNHFDTVVNGEVLLENGTHTGSYPGRVLYNARYHRPRCGGRLRLIATVEDPDAIRAIQIAVAVSRGLADRAPPLAGTLGTSHAAKLSA